MTKEAIDTGSGNLFADLGYADADTHLFKAQLVPRLQDAVAARGLSQTAAAKLAGIGQPDMSRILRGNFREVSVERIMRMLTRLGCEVDVVVRAEGSAIRFGGAT